MNQEESLGREFDGLVRSYNEWLASRDKKPRTIVSWVAGLLLKQKGYYNPLYCREDLTPEQKDAIALASDWQRVNDNLEKILREEERIQVGKGIIDEMYNSFKQIYIINSKNNL